jgi:hypothetical protein
LKKLNTFPQSGWIASPPERVYHLFLQSSNDCGISDIPALCLM